MWAWLASILLVALVVSIPAWALEYVEFEPDEPSYTTSYVSGIIQFDPNTFTSYNLHRYIVDGGIMVQYDSWSHAVPGVMRDMRLTQHSQAANIGHITGSTLANDIYNLTGRGVVIAVVDTGVDFSNPDMMHAIARDSNNHPVMLDPDGQGIVMTNATFAAHIDDDGLIRNISEIGNNTSRVYVDDTGVYLDINQAGAGTVLTVYNSFYPLLGPTPLLEGLMVDDVKIGNSNRDYIRSQSGIYHFGVGVLLSGGHIMAVPFLIVDSQTAGIYDMVIPDMSTSWKDFLLRHDSEESPSLDFDFTDETPIMLGSGNEVLVYDHDGDGYNDYSAGVVGAKVLDIYGVLSNTTTPGDYISGALNTTLLEPLDVDGNYLGVMTDAGYHGTAVSGVIASRGSQAYDIYNDTDTYTIPGVAPDAQILPIKALWYGSIEYGWLWAAGMDNDGDGWTYTGDERADIITNSWGVSTFPSMEEAPGYDEVSTLANILATPGALHRNHAGVIMISSTGNSGHGYGTVALPGAASLGISIGASTSSAYVSTPAFKEQPRFGSSTIHDNHMVDFSSRGPGIVGDPKPDLISLGAFGFSLSPVTKTSKDATDEPYGVFGGTSMSGPLAAGAAALLVEQMRANNIWYTPFTIKNILMSTANDMGNDPFVQGAGLVNATRASEYVAGDGSFLVTNDMSYTNIRESTLPALQSFNNTIFGIDHISVPPRSYPMSSWFAGHLHTDQKSPTTFTITNPTNQPLAIQVEPQTLEILIREDVDLTTIPHQQDPVLNDIGIYAPNYVLLSDVRQTTTLTEIFEPNPIPESSLLVLNVNFDFDDFLNSTADVFADDFGIASLYLYDWIDENNDGTIEAAELAMVNRAGNWGTVQEMRVSYPHQVFEGEPVVGVYPVPVKASYWRGITNTNSTAMDYTITATYYDRAYWPDVWLESSSVVVPPQSQYTINAVITVPSGVDSGIYQGFVTFSSDAHTVNIPVSYAVTEPANGGTVHLVSGTSDDDDILYSPGLVRGSFDMSGRYMAGEWRHQYIDVPDDITSGVIEVSWQSNNTSIGVFVLSPEGDIIQSNTNPGVFGHFGGWPSNDWLGYSDFGEGGGFFPVSGWNDTSATFRIPIEEPGVYSIMTHTTLFGGESPTEPIVITVRFD
ncbi:MAG: S8 family serine peptidase [Cenarchaeum sp. SB0661_bin_35]|nr:S8 family serine peptidase [Cenarchaeum sp. SB0667_bin_13]MXZ93274.1 S8 family serine peptidase [Cenarchaeum sp. SB0666_bin_15]MYB47476.1 S8 family serine peptidase [Cenarchaeum sp. SB0662_bin_33]MYC79321.1 S8 family serine peptidase [Cenarchaeum sp. SB0661_bin_35]MYD58040.1 S8 family serine peptidase [Cenarchaeum sp. SB0678_bin_8]MYI52343.1 S8 family serine peptidase [Cenarchaeum sp. SB0673_bin_9]MYJ27456.1 S8 family serine peptidase [Cenarchaeum sp. SB0672_bin_9]